jgi:hypothetical protein
LYSTIFSGERLSSSGSRASRAWMRRISAATPLPRRVCRSRRSRGRARAEVEDQVREIAVLLGTAARGHDILFSTRILKKTGLRLA